MATRRIKSFSPYKYNVQYAKAGEGPNQQPRPYVNMAILPEEHFVIAKKDPNWYVYVINTAIFSLDEECNLNLERTTSELSIIEKSEKREEDDRNELIEVEEDFIDSLKVDITRNSSQAYTWTSPTSVEIFHDYDSPVDCIIMANNEYLKISKNISSSKKIVIRFSDDFKKSDYNSIIAILYRINDLHYPVATKNVSQIEYDRIHNVISCENKFYSNKCVPMIFGTDNWSYVFENIDLTPNRILVNANGIKVVRKYDLRLELEEVDSQINQILNDNQTIPSSVLINENSEFSGLIDRRNSIYSDFDLLGENEEYMDIDKVMLYSINDKCFSTAIKYGINTQNVQWLGSSVTIEHGLNGYVNVIVDDTLFSQTSYKVYDVSPDKIGIIFSNPKYAICTVRIFKIGER